MLVVIGTRPEAIKMAPVVHALRARGDEIEHRIVLTGQHTELVEEALRTFELEPDHDLEIMRPDQSVYDVIQGSIEGLRRIVSESSPAAILVQGDTATVFAATLVGFLERVPVGHVEAGLRSRDFTAPFPEEGFRHMTDVVATWYFAPTLESQRNLEEEGVSRDRVNVTGNTVVDALQHVIELEHTVGVERIRPVLDAPPERRVILLTAHRRESFGEPLSRVFRAVRALVDEFDDIDVIYPVHPNPNVLHQARADLADHPRIHLIEPLGYLDLVAVMRRSYLILTDSGGIQEEAPAFGTQVLVLRDVTERPEGVEAGVAVLVGTDPEKILEEARKALQPAWRAFGHNPYGDGSAGERIADILIAELTGASRRTRDWRE